MRIAICVITYLRPEGLTRLLRGLDRLEFAEGPPELEVVVVDNDPEGSARATCEAVRRDARWPLRYHHEPRRGISFARNAAVAAARDRADFLALIDDDEIPEPDWLDELLRVQRRFDADVVSGPVIRHFESEAPTWMVRGGFFEDPRFETGASIEHPATNNALIRSGVFRGMEEPFDARMALSGGEDTHFFLRLARQGRRMVWADEAVVRESIPDSRARTAWILQRAFRRGNTWSLCERELRPSARVAALRVAKGVARIGMGVAALPLAPLAGRHRMVKSLQDIWFGAGNLAGLVGLRYQEYKTTHGR